MNTTKKPFYIIGLLKALRYLGGKDLIIQGFALPVLLNLFTIVFIGAFQFVLIVTASNISK
jgi:hypothetical protein